MTNFDVLLNELNDMPLFPEIIPSSPPNLCPMSEEISLLNSRLEHLSLDVHTQSFRVTIERAKRQKFGAVVNKMKIFPKRLRNTARQ